MTKKNVPAAELEILACLQKLGGATAREIREELHAFRPMTHGALLNLLKWWTPIVFRDLRPDPTDRNQRFFYRLFVGVRDFVHN